MRNLYSAFLDLAVSPTRSLADHSRLSTSGFRIVIASLIVLSTLLGGALGASAQQSLAPEEELARRFTPIIVLQQQQFPCDTNGEPFLPAPVDVVFGDPAVTLREGPQQEPVKSPVENADLFGLSGDVAIDFPGRPRTPGCDFETHFKRVMGDQPPVAYAAIRTEGGRPGIALQYWFFYYFNDFNNLHEGDWEMIQLLFTADSVEEALTQEPVQVAFAQHSGGETAAWDAPKLEREGTRPVVYTSSGSHASYYGPGLWLGWGQDGSGLGCDITDGDRVRIDPEVRLIPDDIAGADDPFAWVTFSGRWGERETWVYDGPTGPAQKPHWTAPVTWMESLRADSIRVSGGAILGPAPTGIFCTVVENVSGLVTLFKPYPLLVIAIVALGLGFALWAVYQTWPALRQTWRVYWPNFRVLAGIGAITIPASLSVGLLHFLLATSQEFATRTNLSEDSSLFQAVIVAVSVLQQGLLLLIVTPAVIQTTSDIIAGRPPGVRRSLRVALAKIPDLAWTFVRGGLVLLGLAITIIGIPWAVNRYVRWMFAAQATILGELRGKPALVDSARAVHGRWWQAAVAGGVFTFLGAAPGVVVGLVLMVLVRFPVDAANGVAALVYALVQPFATTGLTLLYLRWRGQPVPERSPILTPDIAPAANPAD